MWRCIVTSLLCLGLGMPLHGAGVTVDTGRTYTLLSRSASASVQPSLTPAQRTWLAERRELVLGTSAPDYPPFDIATGGREYQGLTADYAGLIGSALGLSVRVQRFPSRPAAVAALKSGHIDCWAVPTAMRR